MAVGKLESPALTRFFATGPGSNRSILVGKVGAIRAFKRALSADKDLFIFLFLKF